MNEKSQDYLFVHSTIGHFQCKLDSFLKDKIAVDCDLFILFVDIWQLSQRVSVLLIDYFLKLRVLYGRGNFEKFVVLKHTWVAICFKALHHYRCSKGNIQPSLSVE